MTDEEIRQKLETGKQAAISWGEWGYTFLKWGAGLAALTFAVVLVIISIYLIPALKDWRESNKATARGWTEFIDKAGPEITQTVERLNTVAGNLDTLTKNGADLTADARTSLVKLNKVLDNGAVTIEKGGMAIENVGKETESLISRTNHRINDDKGLLDELTGTVHSVNLLTQNELRDAVAQIALAGKNLVVITSAPELQSLPAEVDKLAKSLNVSAGHVEVITEKLAGVTTDLRTISEDSSKRIHSLLNPPPAPFWKKYILYPLKNLAGVTYLWVRIANGLD